MKVTRRVTAVDGHRRPGRIVVRADDAGLTPYAGLAVAGELARRLGLAGLIDAGLAVERRARPVKVRRRGLSPGELVVSLAECRLVGGSFFDPVEDVRADGARRWVAGGRGDAVGTGRVAERQARPPGPWAADRAGDGRAGERLARALGRDPGAPVTVDLDATQVTVYGQRKRGAARSRHGHISYAPHVATWAQRGRSPASWSAATASSSPARRAPRSPLARSRSCPRATGR
jgi:hypothetical protein